MKYIFDADGKFFKHLISLYPDNATSTATATVLDEQGPRATSMDDSEREWRMSLEVGTTIDVLKYDISNKQQMWTRGEIVAVTGDMSDISKKMLTMAY